MEQSISLNELYGKLQNIEKAMVTRNELNQLVETLAVLSNPDTMKQINESEKDILEGNIKEINSVRDL